MVTETMMAVNGIELCAETFGEPDTPALLLIAGGASSMDWWEDEFCRRLAAAGRYVIRYDHRDTGRSTSFPAGDPPYSGVDLTNDAMGILDAFGVRRAHVVGLSMGGGIAQRIAVERPHRVLSLTLMCTSPGSLPAEAAAAPESVALPASVPASPADAALTADDSALTAGNSALAAGDSPGGVEASAAGPDWSDRRAAVKRLVADVRECGGLFTAEDAHLRRLAERVYDRTVDMAASQTNHWLCVDGAPIRHRLSEISAPTLVMHGTLDPLFPPAHAEALADEIPGARLVWLEGVGHEFPPAAVWSQVITEITKTPSPTRADVA